MAKTNEYKQNIYDDLHLISMMKTGDESALEVFFDKYMDVLYYRALGMVCDHMAAKDIVQEVFIRFWENRFRLTISTSVFAYLYQAVTNASLNHIEHLEVKFRFVEKYGKNLQEEVEEYDAEELEKLRLRLYAFLETFPDKCREIFILACIDGMKYTEVAECLNISVNTVKTQVKIAYRRLRSEFSQRERHLLFTLFFLWSKF